MGEVVESIIHMCESQHMSYNLLRYIESQINQ